jgi:hypothetical protein
MSKIRFISIITLITFTWTTIVQAFPYPDDSIHAAQNTFSRSTQQQVEGKGLFGKDKEIYSSYQRVNSVGMDAGDTPVEIILGQQGHVDMTDISVKHLTIDPKGGTINFHLGKSSESYQRSEKAGNMFVQSQSMHSSEHQTGRQSRIGKLKVISTEDAPVTLVIEEVRGRTAEFLKRIELDHGQVTQVFWDEVHHEVNQSASSLTAASAALVAVAVGALTYGTGAAASVGGSMATSLGGATGLSSAFAGTCMAGAGEAMPLAGGDVTRHHGARVLRGALGKGEGHRFHAVSPG